MRCAIVVYLVRVRHRDESIALVGAAVASVAPLRTAWRPPSRMHVWLTLAHAWHAGCGLFGRVSSRHGSLRARPRMAHSLQGTIWRLGARRSAAPRCALGFRRMNDACPNPTRDLATAHGRELSPQRFERQPALGVQRYLVGGTSARDCLRWQIFWFGWDWRSRCGSISSRLEL